MSQPLDREEALFADALALPDARRREFLVRACAGDQSMLARIEALLRAHEEAANWLDAPPESLELVKAAQSVRDELLAVEGLGTVIGRYTLVEKLGEGGCGVVYLAEQAEPVRRRVALKIIKLGMDTREVIARFEAERQALALMDHPNIARVFDAGATAAGRPFFVMELVDGQPITKYCDGHQLTPEARLELLITVCQAVQHAHQKGVIHRDLKPSNILVAAHDGAAVPKVIDFGIAKATEGRLTNQTFFTAFEHFIGTPAYMSPEQAGLGRLDIDTRSDIYSLGVLLYELLTGRTPFDAKALQGESVDEIRRRIREVEPPRPSALLVALDRDALASAARSRRLDPAHLAKLLRGDLDWIVMRCLEKDRTRRYETANGLAMDLQRHLGHEPVVARPPNQLYLLRKFVRRHSFGFGAAAAVALVLVLGLIASTWEAVRATRAETLAADRLHSESSARAAAERERGHALAAEKNAQTEASTERAISEFLENDLLAQASPDNQPDRDLKLRTVLDAAAKRIDGRFPQQPLVEAEIRSTLGDTYLALGESGEARRHLERAREIRLQQLGADDPETLRAAALLVELQRRAGQFKEAEALNQDTLDRRVKALGREHPDTLASMQMAATLAREQGRLAAAMEIQTPVLALRQRVLGASHPDTLCSVEEMAALLDGLGKREDGLALHTQVWEARKQVLGPDHPATIVALQSLANATGALGHYTDSYILFGQIVDLRRRILGPEHPDTLSALNDLGQNSAFLGKFDEAAKLLNQVLETRRRVLGPEHPDTLRTASGLANVYSAQHNLSDAAKLMREVLLVRQRVMGNQHPDTLRTMSGLAVTLAALGELAESAALTSTILEARRQVLGPLHPDTLLTADQLGDLYLQLREFGSAEKILHESLVTRRKTSPDEWRTYCTSNLLGGAVAGQQRFEEAEPLLVGGLKGMLEREKQIPRSALRWLREARERVIHFYIERGQPEKAVEWKPKPDPPAASTKP